MQLKKQSIVFLAILLSLMSLGISACKKDSPSLNGNIYEKKGTSSSENESITESVTETEQPQTDSSLQFYFDDATSLLIQSITLAVNYEEVNDENYLTDESILSAMGWYQALLHRIYGLDSITETEALAFQTAMGGNSEVLIEVPAHWKEEGLCVLDIRDDGVMTFSFPLHTEELEADIGNTISIETETCEDGRIGSRLVFHGEDGEEYSFLTCYFIFDDTDGIFPCKLREFEAVTEFYGPDGELWNGGNMAGNALCDLTIIGGSLDYVLEQNLLSSYFEYTDSVTMHYTYPASETEAFTEYFIRNDRYAALNTYTDENGDKQISSWKIPNMLFWNDSEGHVVGNIDFRGYIEGSGMEMESEIADYFLKYGEISTCIDCGETIKLTIENFYDNCYYGWDVYILDKGTLHMIKADTFNQYGDLVSTMEITTGDEVDSSQCFSAWDSTRTVTFIYNELQMDDSIFTTEMTVEIPDTYELLPVLEENVYYYMDEGYTIPYEYPGDGGDYTVYMTNIAG